MAWCTPDMFTALVRLDAEIHKRGGRLVLSDLFRTYDMQLQAHLDWKTGKKSAYSPPPGESMHEAGRAFDLDLGKLGVELPEFWKIARACGLEPIIAEPDSSASEAWHFDCRGSHDFVYKHYIGLPSPNMKPYTAMSVSAVLALGGRVDRFVGREDAAAIQCMLIRLAFDPGLVDGAIGTRTRKALTDAGVTWADPVSMRRELDAWTHAAFPMEYQSAPSISTFDHDPPEHLVP
jgi:D-alanyl-D-alanine dipeptidase